MRTYFHDFYRELEDGSEQKVTVEYTATPYDPGCTYGLPENCYPPEGGEIEITGVTLEDGGDAGATDDEIERWGQWLMENPDDCAHGQPDDGDY